MIERRKPARKRHRVLVGRACCDAEPEVLGDRGHHGGKLHRIIYRHLRAIADRGGIVAAVHVVGAEHVGDEDAVEEALLGDAGQVGPVLDVLVAPRLIFGVTPQARALVRGTVHVERVQTDLLVGVRHEVLLKR